MKEQFHRTPRLSRHIFARFRQPCPDFISGRFLQPSVGNWTVSMRPTIFGDMTANEQPSVVRVADRESFHCCWIRRGSLKLASRPALARRYPCDFTFYLGNPFPRLKLASRPTLARRYPCDFTFYLENPFPRFVVKLLRYASNEGTLRAFCYVDRFPTFKILQ